jgi:hypothetical protein
MGAVPVTISGVMYPKGKSADDTPVPCTIVGYAWATGLGVGGGPVFPSTPPGGGEHPEHPIVIPPAPPIEGGPPLPTHPIVLPEPPPEGPPILPPGDPPGTIVKPPPPGGGWGWSPDYGWGYFPGAGGPGPKRGR